MENYSEISENMKCNLRLFYITKLETTVKLQQTYMFDLNNLLKCQGDGQIRKLVVNWLTLLKAINKSFVGIFT